MTAKEGKNRFGKGELLKKDDFFNILLIPLKDRPGSLLLYAP